MSKGPRINTDTIKLRLPPCMKDRIDGLAAKHGISRSRAVRVLINRGFKHIEEGKSNGKKEKGATKSSPSSTSYTIYQ